MVSARRLARLCEQHDVYRWICGGITVCHRVLSDFRIGHGKALDGLLTQLVAVLMNAGIVQLKRVAQDGTRVRASAGAASFRRERSLKQHAIASSASTRPCRPSTRSVPRARRTARPPSRAPRRPIPTRAS